MSMLFNNLQSVFSTLPNSSLSFSSPSNLSFSSPAFSSPANSAMLDMLQKRNLTRKGVSIAIIAPLGADRSVRRSRFNYEARS